MKGGLVYYIVLGAVLLVGGGLLSITNWADAAGSDRISFTSNSTGNFDIYVMNINGENRRNLTNHPTDEFGPWVPAWMPAHTWSPDGRFLAYVSKRDDDWRIYVIDTRTRERRRLTGLDTSEWTPSWSPDGKWIAYIYSDTVLWQTADIYITDAAGKGRGTPFVTGVRRIYLQRGCRRGSSLFHRVQRSRQHSGADSNKKQIKNLSATILVDGHQFRANQLLWVSGTLC